MSCDLPMTGIAGGGKGKTIIKAVRRAFADSQLIGDATCAASGGNCPEGQGCAYEIASVTSVVVDVDAEGTVNAEVTTQGACKCVEKE